MPDLQSPNPGLKLARLYNLVGGFFTPFLSPEIVPVVIVDDVSDQDPGKAFAAAGVAVSAVALQTSISTLLNPLNSGVNIIDISLMFATVASSQWALARLANDVTPGTEQWQDRRRLGTPVGEHSSGTLLVAGIQDAILQGQILSSTPVHISLANHVLTPGTQLSLVIITINTTLLGGWTWAEQDESVGSP